MSNKSIIGNLKFQKVPDSGFDQNLFAQEIEESYLKQRRSDAFTQKKTFSPSSIGYGHGNCPRYWYYAFKGAEFVETTTAQGLANMQNGSAAHDRIQKVIGSTSRPVDFEVEVSNEDPPIRGYIDGVMNWDGEEVIIEIKTAKEEVYAIRQSSMKPSGNHLLQLLIYMKIRKAAQGVFIYENKNTQELCLIPIRVSDRYIKIIDDLFEWLRETRSAYENDTLPNRVSTKSTPMCKNCPVRDTCWAEKKDDGVVEIRKYEPPK
jgi:CRISPR/Cas system-associated exonuclease Cas4 (RecB family)